jgi:uncharacterized protein YbjT (DUF2867 family)
MKDALVTGGTGILGTEMVRRLVAKGYEVRILTRRTGFAPPAGTRAVIGDLDTGAGLDAATAGVDVIVHCASATGKLSYRAVKRTDVAGTTRLLGAAKRGGSPHVVYISIVGIDIVPIGYYRAKREAEEAIERSGLPFSILRTTQWHTFVPKAVEPVLMLPIIVLPKGFRLQLLDVGEVADRMVALVEAGPSGRAPDMGGPEAIPAVDAFRDWLRVIGKRRLVASVPFPGTVGRSLRDGGNLTPNRAGRITWAEWLTAREAATCRSDSSSSPSRR